MRVDWYQTGGHLSVKSILGGPLEPNLLGNALQKHIHPQLTCGRKTKFLNFTEAIRAENKTDPAMETF